MTNVLLNLICGAAVMLADATEKPEIVWVSDPVRPGQTVMIQGHAFTEDAGVEASPVAGKPMQSLKILDRSNQCLKALIPPDWTPCLFELHVRTKAGLTGTVLLNRPDGVWWVGDQGDRQTPGGLFRICGRNLLGDPKAIRARLTGPKSVDLPVEKAEPFALTMVLPSDTPPGEYRLQVHNGWGQDAGWSDPLPFVVQRAKPWPQTVFNVMDFGAKGRFLTDDTAAVQAALAKAAASGGGIVYFPRGLYQIRDTLKVPRFTVLKGEKREWVELLWPDQPKPIVLVQGSNSFGLEEISLSAFNYLDGIMSDEGWMPGAGDLFLRRVRVRALRYSRVSGEEVHKRFVASTPHSEGGCTVCVGGRNVEVTDCDLYGSGRGFVLSGAKGGRVSGNKIQNGRYGWVCLSGIDGVVFENNEITGADLMSAGCSVNTFYNSFGCQNLYFARNRVRTIFGCDREGTSTDGGGGSHAGRIVSAQGTKLVLSDGPPDFSDIWYKAAKPGMGVYILEGRGAGQWRRVIKQDGRTVEIDRPWLVIPDGSSIVAISTFQGNYFMIDNEYSDVGCAIQTFGISIGHVLAGNTASRAGGFHVWGLSYGSVQPSWYCQLLDNQILEGNGILGPSNESASKESHIAAIGQMLPGFTPPLVRCVVIRHNQLRNNARIELIGSVRDAVVEHNTVENADVGVHVDTTVTGAVVRANNFVNVGRPFSNPEIQKDPASGKR